VDGGASWTVGEHANTGGEALLFCDGCAITARALPRCASPTSTVHRIARHLDASQFPVAMVSTLRGVLRYLHGSGRMPVDR
jgi:hypothetical protein